MKPKIYMYSKVTHPSKYPAPRGFSFTTPWTLELSRTKVGEDEWLYALNFIHAWSPTAGKADFVRRRKWVRQATLDL